MKFQIGDKVIVHHSHEEGEVVDIINDRMVLVDVKGVRFPAYADQIDFPYFKRFTEKREAGRSPVSGPGPAKRTLDQVKPETPGPNRNYRVGTGVWLAFLPVFDRDVFDDDVVDYFKVYLVNQTALPLDFHYQLKFNAEVNMDLKNHLPPGSDFYLQNVPLENINDSPRFEFDFALNPPRKGKASSVSVFHKVRPKQLFKKIEELRLRQEATFSYPLLEDYPDAEEPPPVDTGLDLNRLRGAGYKVYEASRARQYLEPARSVIDLHADKLTESWQRLDPLEIIALQMKTFEKYLDLAILHRQPFLTVIHGVGTGRLRDEVHEVLRARREVKNFVHQYHPRYGYGATEIFFQY